MPNHFVYDRSDSDDRDSWKHGRTGTNPKQRAAIIGGSVAGSVVFLTLLAAFAWYILRRRRQHHRRSSLVLITDPVPEVIQPREGTVANLVATPGGTGTGIHHTSEYTSASVSSHICGDATQREENTNTPAGADIRAHHHEKRLNRYSEDIGMGRDNAASREASALEHENSTLRQRMEEMNVEIAMLRSSRSVHGSAGHGISHPEDLEDGLAEAPPKYTFTVANP